jgi:hypothetical protein
MKALWTLIWTAAAITGTLDILVIAVRKIIVILARKQDKKRRR